MEKIVDFIDDSEKEDIIKTQEELGFRLISDQNHIDGKHLVFDDGIPDRDLAAEIDELKA